MNHITWKYRQNIHEEILKYNKAFTSVCFLILLLNVLFQKMKVSNMSVEKNKT